MTSKSASLRHIETSGGLFTENILLRLRDKPDQLTIGKIESFIEKDTKQLRNQFEKKRDEIFKWCCDTWDDISPIIEKVSLEELIQQWLIPFFNEFGHELEEFVLNEENIDDDNPLKDFKIRFQSKDSKNPFFHFVPENENFKDKIKSNSQNHPYHNICQQFINFNPEIKWLFLSNGRLLRILTKYYHTYSTGYVQFDIENIFANRDKKEFDALFAMIHQSRFIDISKEKNFLIDLFKKQSSSEGVKIGDSLRFSVEKAIQLLGNSLIQQNPEFLDEILLIRDNLDDFLSEFYAELLRIMYRIIFLLFAEKRKMLPVEKGIYLEHFSLDSMRKLAEKQLRVEKSRDLWKKLFITFSLVRNGNNLLEVNSFNGSVFKDENLSIIIGKNLSVTNDIVIRVIRLLTTFKDANIRQKINFSIEEEEIGSIYESLLDLKPHLASNSEFKLISQTTVRKSTGSYYTPKALIDILIRTTLQPLVEDRLIKAGDDGHARESAILDLKVCDPACGGGTFLLSALDYLGKKLAEVRSRSDSPLEDDLRGARREILQHCIYGVDINPLAVELAKISLWLRACVKDKPLNFLDNHIKCGNSLVGLGQKMEIKEINPNAFKAISGSNATGIPSENTKLQNQARNNIKKEIKERKKEGKTTMITSFFTDKRTADVCSIKFQEIINMPENNPEKIIEKEKKYYELRNNENYQQALNEANIWTSTFFWPFEGNALGEIPRYTIIEQLRDKIADPELENLMEKIKIIAEKNQFFHWYIEFPEVFSTDRGGFDCILTNPPWETLILKESEFFTGLNNTILKAPNQAKRRKLIKNLKTEDPNLFEKFKVAWRNFKKKSHFLSKSNFFNLSAKGTINLYAVFADRNWRLISPQGYVGMICPTGIVMNYFMQDFFKTLVRDNSLLSMFDFENRLKLFDIDSRFRFCLLSLGGKDISQEVIPMTFYTIDPAEIQEPLSFILDNREKLKEEFNRLPEDHSLIPLMQEDFEVFNPNTLTCPSFRIKKDFRILKHLYNNGEVLIKKDSDTEEVLANPWKIGFHRMIDMSGSSEFFKNKDQLKNLGAKPQDFNSENRIWIDKENNKFIPLYEGRMIWHYNHRSNSMDFAVEGKKRKAISKESELEQYKDFNFSVSPNYWIVEGIINDKTPEYYKNNWFLVYRNITGATNERTFISTIIPRTAVGHSMNIILIKKNPSSVSLLLSNLNSIVFDYIVRLKIPGTNLGFFIVEQFPIIPLNKYNEELKEIIIKKVLKLVYVSYDIRDYAMDMGFEKEPFSWNETSRAEIQAELDAIYALLYKITKNDLEYIIETFPVLKKKEMEKYGEFKTKRLILEAYDKFSEQKELFE